MKKTTILLTVGIAVLAFAVGTATTFSNVIIPSAQAAKKISSTSSGNSGASGSVPLTSIKTGDTALDKTIQSFYNCIKKTGHTGGSKPEPSKSEVINCYYKEFGSNA